MIARTGARANRSYSSGPSSPAHESKICTACAPASIWRPQVVCHLHRQPFEQPLERRGLAIQHRLDRAEAFLALALHEVGGQRERRAAEADDRCPAVQLAAKQADRLGHERHDTRQRAVGTSASTCARVRTGSASFGPGLKVIWQPSASSGSRMSEKMIDGVEREPPQRLQRRLDRQFGRLAKRQEVDALAQRAILRQVAAGLAHDPQRRAIDRLAPARPQEPVVHERASSKAARAATMVSSMTRSRRAPRR